MRFSAVVVAAGLAGCSFALDGPDPARPRGERPACSTEKTTVILDGLVGTVLGVAAIAIAAEGEALAALPALGGGTYLYAAITGNAKVNDCNAELARYGGEVGAGQLEALERARDAERAAPLPGSEDEDAAAVRERDRDRRRPIERLDGMSGPASAPPGAGAPPTVTPPAATPVAVTPPAPPAAPAPKPPPPAAKPADDWADFWKVVTP